VVSSSGRKLVGTAEPCGFSPPEAVGYRVLFLVRSRGPGVLCYTRSTVSSRRPRERVLLAWGLGEALGGGKYLDTRYFLGLCEPSNKLKAPIRLEPLAKVSKRAVEVIVFFLDLDAPLHASTLGNYKIDLSLLAVAEVMEPQAPTLRVVFQV